MRKWLLALTLIAVVTAIGRAINLNSNTIGFAYLIAVLAISLRGGLVAGMVSSVLATLCYNFFFFEPLYTLRIGEPANWFALAAFLIASVTVNRLVTTARVLSVVRESEALKTSLLRAIAHDLTTPITAIMLRIESLQRRATSDRDDLAAIADETGRLRRRIDNLLSMARLEAGKATPRPEPTPVQDLLRSVRENLPLVPVSIRVDPDCPDANVDPSLTLEILVNLVENAHRASGATVEILARGEGNRVRLEILDRGPGMPATMTQRGLGLEIARSFAVANGGTIQLSQRDGGGTVATVELPA